MLCTGGGAIKCRTQSNIPEQNVLNFTIVELLYN